LLDVDLEVKIDLKELHDQFDLMTSTQMFGVATDQERNITKFEIKAGLQIRTMFEWILIFERHYPAPDPDPALYTLLQILYHLFFVKKYLLKNNH
jgi:hypothetical protein